MPRLKTPKYPSAVLIVTSPRALDDRASMCMMHLPYTHRGAMRTNIDIDDDLLTQAMAAAGLTTKKATVEEALRRLVRTHQRRAALADLSGLGWEGDLAAMREGRETDPRP